MKEQKKEDHRFFSTITTDRIRVQNVLCRIYLPSNLAGPISLLFSPTDEQMKQLDNIFEFSVSGEVKGFSGQVEVSIQSKKVYLQHRSAKHWGKEIRDNVISAWPVDLKISQHFRDNRDSAQVSKILGTFWLTPSIMLTPQKYVERHFNGNVNVRIVTQHKFTLLNGLQLTFDNHYRFNENADGDTITHEELVAKFEAERFEQEVDNIGTDHISQLDDLLMLVSLAERNRCVCLGWDFVKPNAHVKYFRRNVVIPDLNKRSTLDTLIDIIDVEEFIIQAYSAFVKLERQELVRQAILYIVSAYDPKRTFESSFLSLYSALESLVMYFRQAMKAETVFEPLSEDWSNFSDYMRKCIKSYPQLIDDKKRRQMLYQKLSELNRIPFATAFEQFCESYSIDLNDLWPVCDNSEGISLSEIRHRLIHGDYFNNAQGRALISAKENLHWTLERVILSMFGWPVPKSYVSSHFLGRYMTCYKEWKEDRKIVGS